MPVPTSFPAARGTLALDSRSSGTYLDALIEHNPIAIIVLDSNHKFQLCNPAFERLFQFDAIDIETWGIDSVIAGPDFIGEANNLTRRVLSGERVHTLTKRRRKDGLIIDVELQGVPLIVDGRVTGVYGLYQDVTERTAIAATMEQFTMRLNAVREEERRRFARDLHDSLSQELTLLNWNLRRLSQFLPEESEAMGLLDRTRDLADACVTQIRSVSFLMHPPQLGEADLPTAMHWLAEGFERRSGIETSLLLEPLAERLPLDIESALYRVVQEGLANVLRHAQASSVIIKLSLEDDLIILSVTDERSEIVEDTQSRAITQGVGIRGMRERLEEFGGELTLARTQSGMQIRAAVPMGKRLQ